MDRNYLAGDLCQTFPVALLAEGVDRNSPFAALRGYDEQVALLTEGVDRNSATTASYTATTESPSSRRAWIEIVMPL